VRGFGHKHQYTMATGVASHHSQVPCLGLVDLFGGRLETWECEGTQYRCSSDSALSHLNARVYSCWEAAVHRDRLAAPEGFFSSQKTGFLTLATTARLLTESLNQANGGFETPSPFSFPPSLFARGGFEKVADENPSQESFGLLH